MKTAIFYNNKGGVAKTMTCVNLACIYAKRGFRVLVIDLDPQANATHFLLKDKSSYSVTLKQLLDPRDDSAKSLDDVIYPSDEFPNLFVAPAEADLDDSETAMMIESIVSANNEPKLILFKYLQGMTKTFDIVLIDTHPSKKRFLNLNGLVASDYIFIPVDSSPEALDGWDGMCSVIESCLSLNPSLNIGGIIYTKSRNTNADFRAMSLLSETAKDEHGNSLLLDTAIPLRTKAVESRWTKKPLVVYAPTDACSVAYQELADEIEKRMGGF